MIDSAASLTAWRGMLCVLGWCVVCALAQAQSPAHLPQHNTARTAASSPWWQDAVFYEIYPRSFQDSNGDGIGDVNGITSRLDYLTLLGVEAIWIAPMYPSPQVDFGYDISDYESIDPQYGTFADLGRLLSEAHKRNIHVLLDMVLNHTSDQHKWFIEAARSRSSPFHDYYVWSDGKTDASGRRVPPNNWVSAFGGSAWEYVPAVKQFYYHKYYKQQPDLNWRNPAVERAMFDVMRFWLDRGVAGFRLDAIPALFEDPQLRDEPAHGGSHAQGDSNLSEIFTKSGVYTDDLPEVHDVIRRLRGMVAQYPGERVLIGEGYLPDTADLDQWYGGARHDELHLPMDMLVGFLKKLDVIAYRRYLLESQTQLHGSPPLLVFDNHDNARSWDRYGDGVHNLQIAKLIAALLMTPRAAVLMYQGQEIGQATATPTRVEDVRDPIGITGWPMEKGRDGERTPMQWDTSNSQAGFSTNSKTWLPVQPSYGTVNVQTELADPDSLLNWYRRLIGARRTNPALAGGRMVMLDERNPNVLAYARATGDRQAVVVALNMSAAPQTVSLDTSHIGLRSSRLTLLLSSPDQTVREVSPGNVRLPPFGVLIARPEGLTGS